MTTKVQPFVTKPRTGQWREVNEASQQSLRHRLAGEYDGMQWWSGVTAGMMAAFDTHLLPWRTDLERAQHTIFARVEPLEELTARLDRYNVTRTTAALAMRRNNVLFDSGVMHGFKEATAEEPDAEECVECNQRILSAREDWADAYPTLHGWVCNDDCHLAFGGPSCCAAERREGLL